MLNLSLDFGNLFHTAVQPAVQASLSENKPMFIYLLNLNDNDQLLKIYFQENGCLRDSLVSKISNNFICLKLIENSVDYGYLEQIFPNLQTQSFYIVKKGALLDVITSNQNVEEFTNRIDDILSKINPSQEEIIPSQEENIPTHPVESPMPIQNQISEISSINDSHHYTNEESNNNTNDVSVSPPHIPSNLNEESVRRYKEQIAVTRQAQDAERKRIRSLLELDKRERDSQLQSRNMKKSKSTSNSPKPFHNYDSCSLVIRLFDGKSLKGDFKSSQNLNDVRNWLDSETNNSIISNLNSSMPSFATSSNPQPTHYVFHRPGIPRVTYTDSQEFQRLSDLDLCPRSALILKPIYDDKGYTNSYPNGKNSTSLLKSVSGAIGKFGNALYSFFDYGVDEVQQVHNLERSTSPNMASSSNASHRSNERSHNMSRSIGNNTNSNTNNDINQTHDNQESSDYFQSKSIPSNDNTSVTPNIVSINTSRPSSLINFENPSRLNLLPRQHPSFLSQNDLDYNDDNDEDEFQSLPNSPPPEALNGSSSINSRSSTPKPISTPSITRIQTLREIERNRNQNQNQSENQNQSSSISLLHSFKDDGKDKKEN